MLTFLRADEQWNMLSELIFPLATVIIAEAASPNVSSSYMLTTGRLGCKETVWGLEKSPSMSLFLEKDIKHHLLPPTIK